MIIHLQAKEQKVEAALTALSRCGYNLVPGSASEARCGYVPGNN